MPDFSSSNEFSLAELEPVIREILDSGGEFEFKPRGTSMLPLIRQDRDSVTLIKHSDRLSAGDIAFYRRADGHFVLHRVMSASPDGYTMCGDNQTALEAGITDKMVIATVVRICRNGKVIETGTDKKYLRYVRRRSHMPYRHFVLFFRRLPGRLRRLFGGKSKK